MNYVLIIVLLIMFIISILYTQYAKEETNNIEEFQEYNINSNNFYYLSDRKKEKKHGDYCNISNNNNNNYEYDIFTLDNKEFIDNIEYKEELNNPDYYLAHNEFDNYDLIINKTPQPKINDSCNYTDQYLYNDNINSYKKVELDKSKHKKWIELSDVNRPWFIT